MVKKTSRERIRGYEVTTGKEVRCMGICRCLHCPMSAWGCPMARLRVANLRRS